MANLSDSERDRLKGAFAADPELARGLSTMLADLPPGIQEPLMRRLAARLETTSLGGGALVPALTDVIQDALERWDREEG
jgi:signal transduction histidine kinase